MILSPLERAALVGSSPQEFYDNIRNERSPIQPEQIAALLEGTSNFAKGFVNGVYGDIAIPIILAGSQGILGKKIQDNIFWAIDFITHCVIPHRDLAIKVIMVYLYHNKLKTIGKIAGGWYLNYPLKNFGIKKWYNAFGASFLKSTLNTVMLVILGLVANKALIQSLRLSGRLSSFAYLSATGDTNMAGYNPAGEKARKLYESAREMINKPPSLPEMNKDYIQAKQLIDATQKITNKLRQQR
jgi:hypothetical protein